MPYKLGKRGKETCVFNEETGENKGCSATNAQAIAHMRKLYSLEGKSEAEIEELVVKAAYEFQTKEGEEITAEDLMVEKDFYDESPAYVPWGVTSYSEYKRLQEAWKTAAEVQEKIRLFPQLANSIMNDPETQDKSAAIEALGAELAELIRTASSEEPENDAEPGDDSLDAGLDEVPEVDEKAIANREDVSAADKKRAVAEYGNVTYADPKNKKYPIDSEAHIRAAWNYINKPKNSSKYSSSEASAIKRRIISAWKSKVDKKGPPSAAKGLSSVAEEVIGYLKDAGILNKDALEPPENDVLFTKDKDGRMVWIARYSNNFLDDDSPPDIISEKSHRRFVECVEKGVYPYPELWIWHEKSWKLGQAALVAYDDVGFPIAAGYIDPGREQIAEEFRNLKSRGVSHGMPIESIVRDPVDKRVIIEHQTKEISMLPTWGAANKLTSFEIYEKDGMEDDMIPKDKKKELIERWGVSSDTLDRLENLNSQTAAKAAEVGLESKEAPEIKDEKIEQPTETKTATEVKDEVKETPETPTETKVEKPEEPETPLTRKEIADAFAPYFSAQTEAITALKEQLDEQGKQIAALKETKEKSLAEQMFLKAPAASLVAMLGGNRAVGAHETQVKEGELETKPKETPVEDDGPTPIPFINEMLTAQRK